MTDRHLTSEEPEISLRTDNIEGSRIIAATDWKLWVVGAFLLFWGRTTDAMGLAEYAVGGICIILALVFTFVVKKVQVLKGGRWETLSSFAFPKQAKDILGRLNEPNPTNSRPAPRRSPSPGPAA